MQFEFGKLDHLADFDNVLVVDEHGITLYYDLADLSVLNRIGQRPEDFIGKHITSYYTNLTIENSTIMNVLRTGSALCKVEQEMISESGSRFFSTSSTYPINENGKIIGAIEFSKHTYTKENMEHLNHYTGHKIFRKNKTLYTIDDIITVNPHMLTIKEKMVRIAKHNSTVLLNGKTGTGKEVVAQAIHNLSDRFTKPFITLNCGMIASNVLENTLFGMTKSSFEGAQEMQGLFEQAQGGTLFLDEIDSLELHLQAKIVKVIEDKRIRRVGGDKEILLDIRIISATNEDPELLVNENRLRQDLFYRLSVVQIDLPTLVQRREDIEVLLNHYIDFYNSHMEMSIETVQQEVLFCFQRYNWPGNLRELKNAIETAYNNTITNEIKMDDIPARIRNYNAPEASSHPSLETTTLKDIVDDYEKSIIIGELRNANGIVAKTARNLGISKQSLNYKLEKYDLR